jgi:gamma-glutamyltranspeptidase/glutathione hydrolase
MLSRVAAVLLLLAASVPAFARQPVYARHGMVTAQEPLAAEVGAAVLKAGGNAVDAAIATGFALAVTHPSAGNLGGGGFMLVRMANGETAFFDFRERAPAKASHDMYLDSDGNPTNDSIIGWRASGVPGTVRGFDAARKRFGTKPWADLVRPAVNLAKGLTVSHALAESLQSEEKKLSRFPDSKRIFLKGGARYEAGDTLVQSELAATLERIQNRGADEFYTGETARLLAAAMQENGGSISLDDLKNYQVVERKPLSGHYRGYDILTAPPPSSGGVGILQMLGMLEGSGYEKAGAGSAAAIHYVAEVERRFYADRSKFLADPDFYPVPVAKLLAPDYIASRRESIDLDHATSSAALGPGNLANGHESTETTHYNVVDEAGNAVAVTYTLNGSYGSGVTVPGAGFLLNDEMDDFAAKPGSPNMFGLVQGEANAIQPGKRPLSSMTPTIVLKNGKPYLVLGAPGGATIINGVLEVMLNVLDFGMNVQDAIDWPRFHHQWKPDKLFVERGVSPDTKRLLENMGYELKGTGGVGRVEAILIDNGWLQGGCDGRAPDGKAAGY